ncbi:MAG: hypothetical protein KBC42_02520 [Candidatus Pacebacteria bacterium]|jgi:hypothetical protein|nr:hypothetical protein [Candidatus Paceibacterota bacterium]MBP9780775.1 hypothetical protein [Candidatus Paceibacterota bacterium]
MNYESLETKIPKKEPELDSIIEKIQSVKSPEQIETLKQMTGDLLNLLEEKIHKNLKSDVEHSYLEMQSRNLIVRVENLKNIIDCVVEDKSFEIGTNEDHYANSVLPTPEGIKIAFAEGMSKGAIKIMAGYDIKSAVSLDQDHFEVFEIDSIEGEIRDEYLRKNVCRHLHGVIRREFIKHIILRIPTTLFPEERLTSFEKTHQGPFIFRYIKLD